MPVTVTVCATFQFAAVNVTEAGGATVPSVRLLDDTPIVTFAVGWLSRTTVKVAVPTASVVVSPEVGLTVIPATSIANVAVSDTSEFIVTVKGFAVLEASPLQSTKCQFGSGCAVSTTSVP